MDTITNSVETLYALYHKDIVRFFAEHLADRETSWDLCHEVFLRLLLTSRVRRTTQTPTAMVNARCQEPLDRHLPSSTSCINGDPSLSFTGAGDAHR